MNILLVDDHILFAASLSLPWRDTMKSNISSLYKIRKIWKN